MRRLRSGLVAGFGLALLLALPAMSIAETTLHFVPGADLPSLDPLGSTSAPVKMHGYMVYDTLFAQDENYVSHPQMVDTFTVSPDGLTYSFTLRDKLMWHDGTPVTAEDCVASLQRWMKRDGAGQLIAQRFDRFEVIDARTFEIHLKQPYGMLIDSLAKSVSNVPFMMPKRIAETDPLKEIKEPIGSGPFKFVASEWVPGSKVVYEKFDGYVPRPEPASGFAGGKVVNVDRVEWDIMPDAQTAMSALIAKEVDYWEAPLLDFVPILSKTPGITVEVTNKAGLQGYLRPNHLYPPFDKPEANEALFWLVNQQDYLDAAVGNRDLSRTCAAMFMCGMPMESDAGSEALMGHDPAKAKALFQKAGWDFSKPLVVLDATDDRFAHNMALVTAQTLRSIGLTVDLQASDTATVIKRRNSKEPPEKGGWNLLQGTFIGLGASTPVWSPFYATSCDKALFGWPCDQELEKLRLSWPVAATLEERKKIAAAYQKRAYEIGVYVPLGQWTSPVAHLSTITGVLPGQDVTLFWNMKKAAE